jgi:signal transduction histidine kinase
LPWGADPFSDWLPWLIGITLSWLSMLAVASQQRLLAELHAAQADLARRSAAQERQRIAREVHDVIAHTLAVTMLHLTGARHILTRDPERAAEALAEAERLGRQSLADIRRTVGLLGEGTDGAAVGTAPLPGAADLPALVTGYVRAGMQARLRMDGDPRRLPAAAGLDLYRIAQEALTNAVKHAPGAAVAVSLAIGENEARLRIVDDGPRDGAPEVPTMRGLSLGLAGMRERAALLGGSLTVGREGAGWLVECVVPLHSPAPQSGPAGRDPREGGP